MGYRTPGERSPTNVTAAPPQRFRIERYGALGKAALLTSILGVMLFGAAAFYRESSITCTRERANAVPRCEVIERAMLWPGDAPSAFDMGEKVGWTIQERDGSDDAKFTVLVVPGGALQAAVTQAWAEETIAGAKAFRANGAALRWVAHQASYAGTLGMLGGTVVMLVFMLLIFAATTIEIDVPAKVVRIVKSMFGSRSVSTHPFAGLRGAEVDSIDDSAFFALLLVGEGARARVAEGREDLVRAAARSINLALRDGYESMGNMPKELRSALESEDASFAVSKGAAGPFAGWRELEDEAKWDRMQRFLEQLPIDGRSVVRNKKDRRIEARGTKLGHPMRVVFDPVYPGGTEVESKAKGRLGFLDLEFDPDAKPTDQPPLDPTWDDPEERSTFFAPGVFSDDAKATAAFRSLPADLQERITSGMRKQRIRHFRVRPEETTADCHGAVLEQRDPLAHVAAVIELVGEAAAYAASATPLEPGEEDDDDEDEDEGEDDES